MTKKKMQQCFFFIIESVDKNNKVLMDVMDKINCTQLEIE
jgi:hypothetical protein